MERVGAEPGIRCVSLFPQAKKGKQKKRMATIVNLSGPSADKMSNENT